ncbi:unnamed protein product [Diamesa serratosioi]
MLGCQNQQTCDVLEKITSKEMKIVINIGNIDRHVLEDKFTVMVRYHSPQFAKSRECYTPKYTFKLPFFEKSNVLEVPEKKTSTVVQAIKNLAKLRRKDKYLSTIAEYCNSSFSFVLLRHLLDIETCSAMNEEELIMTNVKLMMKSKTFYFEADSRFQPGDWKQYSICFIPNRYFRIFSHILEFKNRKVYFEIPDDKQELIKSTELYDILFAFSTAAYEASLEALISIDSHYLQNYFLEFAVAPEKCPKIYSDHSKVETFKWINENISTNQEQMRAIKNIVNCTAYPFPFIIFGPPGTGKTSTMVECVCQILQHKPNSRILITAQSNSACDEVGVRLMKVVDRKKIFRYYSLAQLKKQKNTKTHPELIKISNLRNNCSNSVSYEEIYYFNVVIVTLLSSNKLVEAAIKPEFYDYIFVDECASAAETECLVPIMGMGTTLNKITTNIVLLGDHKQLGPVIKCQDAEKLGFGVSLMERMMTKERYKDCPSYDNNYIVQLLDNYRNHPAILLFSNENFYDSKLRAKAPQENVGKFPIIFHCVKERSMVEKDGTSSYNRTEVKIVKSYVDSLLLKGYNQLDIGIISPYKAQLSKIEETLKYKKDIEIGTAEYYQGREKKIIIISTVKSKTSVGFLKCEKRFNVMLTRAKSMVIIVGNPETLQKDKMWRKFINYCENNNAFVGKPFKNKSKYTIDSVNQLTNTLKNLELVEKSSK